MLRPIVALAATGIIGLVLLKLLGWVVFPVLGVVLGALIWFLKVGLIIALIYWGYQLFKRWTERGSEGAA
jgi:hypothetical protein